jgi:hypothetical protein
MTEAFGGSFTFTSTNVLINAASGKRLGFELAPMALFFFFFVLFFVFVFV